MPSWTVTQTHPTQGRTFQRSLDPTEFAFLLDGHFNGTSDGLHHAEVRLLNASRDAHLFSDANILNAWVSTKRRHPLAGATIKVLPPGLGEAGWRTERDDSVPTVPSEPHFVVREQELAVVRPHELVFGHVACAGEVPKRMAAIWDGPRPLSDDLLVQLYVFRETDPQRSDILHLIALIAHCVADGMAKRTFMRCLLDTLARGGEPGLEPAQVPLEERLEMLIPTADLEPMHLRSLSPATRRWRQAVGSVIFRLRMEKHKGKGGHTLPCRRTRVTPFVPARSGFASTLLTQAQTTTVLANCHLHGLTFGCAYLALAQVAMTRMLYRRYLRGEISDEEWRYRKRQPYSTVGPVNSRPYLAQPWYEMGGGGEFMLSISMFSYQLPFMTLGGTEPHKYRERGLSDGAPPFSDLLTFNRFLHRAGLVKKQAKAFFSHPLFSEIIRATGLGFARRALRLKQNRDVEIGNGSGIHGNDEILAVTEMPSVIAHGGSSLGNVELIVPTEYPLSSVHPLSPFSSVSHPARAGYVVPPPLMDVDTTPRIVVENAMAQLHTRSEELYLGALTSCGRLKMYVFYDGNVYEEGVVREWLDEVREAVLWYLGQTRRSRRDHGHDSGAPRA